MPNNGSDRPVALVILDGWGYAPRTETNAIAIAHTPYYDEICRRFPMTTLAASGAAVGLYDDEPGNAEVGHLNLGTGRTAKTDISRIREALASGEFEDNPVLQEAFADARTKGGAVHLIGLLSHGGVHSSAENLFALLRIAKKQGVENVFIHGILDGVDVPIRTADVFVEALEIKLAEIGVGQVATLCGRFFAMDTSGHWERTARVFTMLVHGEGERSRDSVGAIRNSFLRGISDEFIAPIVLERSPDTPVATIRNGDLVVFFNHRADGMRQLVRSLCVPEGASGAKPVIETVTLTEYDSDFGLPAAFAREPERNTLVDILAANQLHSVKISDTARVPHLTTLFDGGADIQRQFEEHIFLPGSTPSPEVPEPEGRSFKITDRFLSGVDSLQGGFFVVNLPAADLISESGNMDQTVAAVQYMDTCLGGICEKIERSGGVALITSTHGRCEEMTAAEDDAKSLPTANPVPIHLIDYSANGTRLREDGSLADVAPTILGLFGFEKPDEMTGSDLRVVAD